MSTCTIQLDLLAPKPPAGSLDDRFARWAASDEGAATIAAFIRAASALKAGGRGRYGAKALIEELRFNRDLPDATRADGFKLNNNWTSRLVRLVVHRHPELKGFFYMRELQS